MGAGTLDGAMCSFRGEPRRPCSPCDALFRVRGTRAASPPPSHALQASTSAPEASDASVPASKPRGWDREGAPTKQLCAVRAVAKRCAAWLRLPAPVPALMPTARSRPPQAIMRRCNTRGQELISAQGIHAVCASVRTALDARRAIK